MTGGFKNMIRINKLIAKSGLCSRRQADSFLEKGWIRLQQQGPPSKERVSKSDPSRGASLGDNSNEWNIMKTPGIMVPDTTQFEFLPPALQEIQQKVSLILHKPVGYVSSQPVASRGHIPAIQLLTAENGPQRREESHTEDTSWLAPRNCSKLAVAGRLDLNSSGLLLFTQHGPLATAVLRSSGMEKEYLVRIPQLKKESVDQIEEKLHNLYQGVSHDGPEVLEAVSIQRMKHPNQLQFVLNQGKNHHIRRMCAAVGWTVETLKRVRIGPIRLNSLPLGKWRYLRNDEVAQLIKAQ